MSDTKPYKIYISQDEKKKIKCRWCNLQMEGGMFLDNQLWAWCENHSMVEDYTSVAFYLTEEEAKKLKSLESISKNSWTIRLED